MLEFSFLFENLEGMPLRTSAYPRFVKSLLYSYPEMKRHACDNGTAKSLEMELEDTEIAHAFEHFLIEIIAAADISRSLIKGKTGTHQNHPQGLSKIVITAPLEPEVLEKLIEFSADFFERHLKLHQV